MTSNARTIGNLEKISHNPLKLDITNQKKQDFDIILPSVDRAMNLERKDIAVKVEEPDYAYITTRKRSKIQRKNK